MRNIFVIVVHLIAVSSLAQKKVAILGSSTSYGNGASVPDSAWVARLQASFRKNTSDGIDTLIDNRALPGYVTYQSLPTGYPTPADRPAPDPQRNITYILNDVPRADIVIINYPTNDIVNGYNPKEMMDNLRLLFQQFNSNGILCYISTTQPRNTATDAQRTILRQLVDSIRINFGNYAINFWDDLVTSDGTNMLKPEVNADGTHPNDLGHRLLFQRVQAKNIFNPVAGAPLPIILQNWQASLNNNIIKLNWHTVHEDTNIVFEIQRSSNGKDFQTLLQLNGTGQNSDYSWSDISPLKGKNFYRLKIIETTQSSYSKIISVLNDKKQVIEKLYADASQLHVQLNNSGDQSELIIINSSGAIVKKHTYNAWSNANFTVPISELSSGEYYLTVTTSDGLKEVRRFTKLK
jgi:lysophospholipase L1-like esterase